MQRRFDSQYRIYCIVQYTYRIRPMEWFFDQIGQAPGVALRATASLVYAIQGVDRRANHMQPVVGRQEIVRTYKYSC